MSAVEREYLRIGNVVAIDGLCAEHRLLAIPGVVRGWVGGWPLKAAPTKQEQRTPGGESDAVARAARQNTDPRGYGEIAAAPKAEEQRRPQTKTM